MGKRKRNDDFDKKLSKLRRKIKKLEREAKGSSRSRSPSTYTRSRSPTLCTLSRPTSRLQSPEPIIQDKENEMEVTLDSAEEAVTEIDPEILAAMGTVEVESTQGPAAHKEIVQRWTPILTKGLKKEEKALLIKEYTPFCNIPAMIPPKLNPELSGAVSEPVKKRDSVIENRQNNVATSLAAIGRGLECFLTKHNKIDGIKHFNDAAKLLCEMIHTETQSRRTLIQTVINKDMKDCLNGSPDEFLFGGGLTEKIKVAKAIQKSAQDLTKTLPKPNIPPNHSTLNSRVPPQSTYKRSIMIKQKSNNQQGSGGKKYPKNQSTKIRRPLQPQQQQRSYKSRHQ
ncbi:hypothetical protein ACJJTC_001802 [Scirpophaga incertulas]